MKDGMGLMKVTMNSIGFNDHLNDDKRETSW